MTASVQAKPKMSASQQMVETLAKQLGVTPDQAASAQKWVDGLDVTNPAVRMGVYLLAQKMGKKLAPRPKKTTGPKKATKSAPAPKPAAAPAASPVVAATTPVPPARKGLFGRKG